MTDIAIKLPDTMTVLNFVIPIALTKQTRKEIDRFFKSLEQGSTAFVGSVSVNIEITKINVDSRTYIEANYKVLNTVSSQSFYLRLPNFITGTPHKDWKQIYEWSERYPCCEIKYAPKQSLPNTNIYPTFAFPVLY